MLSTTLFAITGYVRFSEVSVCMDNCSIYYLEDENGEFLSWITYLDSIEILDNYDYTVKVVLRVKFHTTKNTKL